MLFKTMYITFTNLYKLIYEKKKFLVKLVNL